MRSEIDLSTANPKQIRFFKSHKRFVGYGGARGGGKSWAIRKKAVMMALHFPGIKILLLRRTYADVEKNHLDALKNDFGGLARYNKTEKMFRVVNSSIIYFGYCDTERDLDRVQGLEYDVIFIDEATQIPFNWFERINSSIRGANAFPKRMYLSCNPGGIGHEWVKRLFITRKYTEKENPDNYEFIPATLRDNAPLMEKDPGYLVWLESLSEDLRQAWLYGNWDSLAGQYFSEFDRSVHVVEPFPLPGHWKRYAAIDYGLDCLACVWVAVDEPGNYYVYREYARPDMNIGAGAAELLALSEGEELEYTVAPPDIWGRSQESGRDKADIFRENGLALVKGSSNREAGWLAIKERLRVIDGEARLKIFCNCTGLIEHLPALLRDRKRPTDCMTEPHEITHLPDALRYFMLQYTSPPKAPDNRTYEQKYMENVLRKAARRRGW